MNGRILPIFSAVAAVSIWGASPAATAFAMTDLSADIVGSLRSVLAAFVLLPLVVTFRGRFPKATRDQLELVVGGVAGFALQPIVLSHGVQQTSIAHASLILAAAPLFTGLISFALSRQWPRRLWWLGGLVALVGVGILAFSREAAATGRPATLAGDALIFLAMLLSSVSYVMGGRTSARIGMWPATVWSLIVGAIAVLPLAVPGALAVEWHTVSATSLGGLAFLVVFVVIIGYAAWFWALGQIGAAMAAPMQFGQPIVGVLLALILFAEAVTLPMLVAGALTLVGVAICTRR